MNRPSPLVLLALMLTAAAALVGRPFVKTALIFAILVLGCVALFRIAAGRLAPSSNMLPPRFTWALWLIAGMVGCLVFSALLIFQPRLRVTYAPDHLKDVVAAESDGGLYAVQGDPGGNRYAWTQQQATFAFKILTNRPITVTLMMRSAAYAGGPDVPVSVDANGVAIGQIQPNPGQEQFQAFALRFVPPDRGQPQTELRLMTTPFMPKGDRRTLGTMVQSVTIDATEAWAPITSHFWLLWLLPALALVALSLTGIAYRWRNRWANYGAIVVCVGGMVCTIVLIALILKIGYITGATYVTWLLGNAYIGSCFALAAMLLPMGQGRDRSLAQQALRFVRSLDIPRVTVRARASDISSRAPTHVGRMRIVADLAIVFAIAFGVRVVWTVMIPPWLAPDERDHYTYVAYLGELGKIPHPPYPSDPGYPSEYERSWLVTQSADIRATDRYAREGLLTHFPVTNDYGPARDFIAPPADRTSPNGARATNYPPLYYAVVALPYRLVKNAPILTRLFAARTGSALFGGLSCVFGYLFGYEVRRQRQWGWAVALSMAFLPMYVFDSAIVNNDAAMNLFAAALVWLSVRALLRPTLSPTLALSLGIVSGLTLLSKPTAFPVIAIAGTIILIKVLPGISTLGRRPHMLRAVGMYVLGGVVLYGPWLAFRSYYLGRPVVLVIPFRGIIRSLSGVSPVAAMPLPAPGSPSVQPVALGVTNSFVAYLRYEGGHGWGYFHDILIRSFWGYFGWLDLPLADWVFVPITVVCIIGLIGAGLQLALQPERRTVLLLAWAFVLAQFVFLFGIVNYFNYRAAGEDLGLAGRYFFPVLVPFLFLLLSGWTHLCRENPIVVRVAPAMMLALQLSSLALVISHYYGVSFG